MKTDTWVTPACKWWVEGEEPTVEKEQKQMRQNESVVLLEAVLQRINIAKYPRSGQQDKVWKMSSGF